MAYTPKPGSFSLFKNDRKEKDTHPDYRGDGALLDGTPAWISAWLKEANGKKFFSISIKPKDDQGADFRGGSAGPVAGSGRDDPAGGDPFSDDIPFISANSIL
jgi:hypothetical protein